MAAQTHIYISQSLDESFTPPLTPPLGKRILIHSWPEPETEPEGSPEFEAPWAINTARPVTETENSTAGEPRQEVLLLHAPKQKYKHTRDQPIPNLENDREMLVQVEVVGLNPIDWKAPDFGFGLPELPCISGRDFAGKVVQTPRKESRFRVGDRVMAVATDYRDSRKSAYQQFAAASDFNVCKLPPHVSANDAAPLGVAFVAAVLALGICLGVRFDTSVGSPRGPDLLRIVRALPSELLPEDIRSECFDGIPEDQRAKPGDWLAIWGGSSATGCCAVQLAKLAGLKVIAVIDVARSGERMLRHGADLLVDRIDTDRAVSIVKNITGSKLRFGLDTRGKESAALLAQAMQKHDSHLVGLTGLPKEKIPGVSYHSVPIKLFHELPDVGEQSMLWLEKLLGGGLLATPDIEVAEGGLGGINAALDRLRDGTVNGPRIVVPL